MTSLPALKKLESEWRKYTSNGWYSRKMRSWLGDAVASIKGKQLSDCFEDLGWMESRTRDLVQVKSLVAWGSADLGMVERAFDVTLPSWAHQWYQHLGFAVFGFRNPIRLLTPNQIVRLETRIRGGERSEGLPVVPVRLIMFALAGIEGNGFAFRQNTQSGQWEIAFFSSVDTREEFQSAARESWERYDADFDHWLERMIQTDGHPLMIGREETEVCHTEREHNPKYKR